MTYREAESLYYLQINIESIQRSIEKLEKEHAYSALTKSMAYDGMPKGHGGRSGMGASDKHLDNVADLRQMLEYSMLRREKLRNALVKELNEVDDLVVHSILNYRCLCGWTWDAIGEEMHMNRTTASRRYKKYFGIDT